MLQNFVLCVDWTIFAIKNSRMQGHCNNRIEYIDIAKCLALVLVVYSHTPFILCQKYIGSFFIAAFFFLSGYTGSVSRPFREHVAKRVVRLLVPYTFFTVALIILSGNYSVTDIVGALYSRYCLYPLGTTGNTIFLRSCNAPLWFLTAMFVSDTVYYALVRKFESKGLAITILLLAVLLIVSAGLSEVRILLPWSLDTMPFFVSCMWVGRLTRVRHWMDHGWMFTLIMVLVYVLACNANGGMNLSCRFYGNSVILCFISGISGTLLLMDLCRWLEKTGRFGFLSFAGQHTLTVFCLQLAVIHVFRQLMVTAGIVPQGQLTQFVVSMLMIVAVFVVGIMLSVVLRRLFPKVF